MNKQDIQSISDIKNMVDSFYGKIRKDELLGPIFNERIGDKWPEHLDKMYRFWQTILLGQHTYSGTPFAPHATMPIDAAHFERWVSLFIENIATQYKGPIADEAISRAKLMAHLFQSKLSHLRSNPSFNSIV